MPQLEMIDRVRALCASDDRVVAAWMYGSFAAGEADAYSDIEFLIYLRDEALASFDPVAWLNQVAPVALYFINEFGVGAALFENAIRGEFHFEPHSALPNLLAYGQMAGFPPVEQLLVVDKTGELRPLLTQISGPGPARATPKEAQRLIGRSLNWLLFGLNVLARGERVRALELLGPIHRHLLWLARLKEGALDHYATPARCAEAEFSPAALARLAECTAALRGVELERAYAAAWRWTGELHVALAARYDLALPTTLLATIAERFAPLLRAATPDDPEG